MITAGQDLSRSQIVDLLRTAGYREAASTADPRSGLYRLPDPHTVEAFPSGVGATSLDAVRLVWDADGARVMRLDQVFGSRALPRVELPVLGLLSYRAETQPDGKTRFVAFVPASLEGLRGSPLVDDLLEVEDRRFRDRITGAVDVRSLGRALFRNLKAGRFVEGGSTVEQQVAGQLLGGTGPPSRSLRFKLRKVLLAYRLSASLSKDEVLLAWLNTIPLGSGRGVDLQGVEAACQAYWGRRCSDLTAPQAAFLAGLVQGPARHPLNSDPSARVRASRRYRTVVSLLQERGRLTEAEAKLALEAPPVAEASPVACLGPAMPLVRKELEQVYGAESPTLVFTTIDPVLSLQAQGGIDRALARLRRGQPDLEAASVLVDWGTGEVLAVSQSDYDRSGAEGTNYAFQMHRPVGSLWKPFVLYAIAARTTGPARATADDGPVELDLPGRQRWVVRNFGDHYSGRSLTASEALAPSSNVVFAAQGLPVYREAVDVAERAGLPRPPEIHPASILGTASASLLDLANAYSTLLRRGVRSPLRVIRTVETASARVAPAPGQIRALDPDVTDSVVEAMRGVVDAPEGTAHSLRRLADFDGVPLAAKTGTSRDSLFVGATPRLLLATVVFRGGDTYRQSGLTGAEGALLVWSETMTRIRRARPELFSGRL